MLKMVNSKEILDKFINHSKNKMTLDNWNQPLIDDLENIRNVLIDIDVELFEKYVDKLSKKGEVIGILEDNYVMLLYVIFKEDLISEEYGNFYNQTVNRNDYEKYKKALLRKQRKLKLERVKDE